ncbi:MAG: hypothetical protein IJS59_00425 [Bacteroidaceae bacterium]|nr:hypothetical protein [Bacteroidaceae bacterium]
MKVFQLKHLPLGKNFLAICLFGHVFARGALSAENINHESIHAAQQRELLYIPFYIWYVAEWLVLLVKHRDTYKAYRHIRFEEEAYAHQHDDAYLQRRRHYRYRQ